jgi:hypothetical protein
MMMEIYSNAICGSFISLFLLKIADSLHEMDDTHPTIELFIELQVL